MDKKTPGLLALLPIVALLASVFAAPGPARASEDDPYGFVLGVVSADEGWRVVVNEGKRVLITGETNVLDHRERPASRYGISEGGWVYAEGEILYDGALRAERIYLLPKPPRGRGAGKYTFIKIPVE